MKVSIHFSMPHDTCIHAQDPPTAYLLSFLDNRLDLRYERKHQKENDEKIIHGLSSVSLKLVVRNSIITTLFTLSQTKRGTSESFTSRLVALYSLRLSP